jgi:hypothetical protein
MRVHETGDDEFAASVNDLGAVVSRQVLPHPLDCLARDKDVSSRGLVDVTVMVVDATAPDQNARDYCGLGHRPNLSTFGFAPTVSIEDRPAEDAFEMASETEFQLWPVKWRRRQLAPKGFNVEHSKNVANDAKDFVECLAEPFYRREGIDALDARGARDRGVVYLLRKRRGNSFVEP